MHPVDPWLVIVLALFQYAMGAATGFSFGVKYAATARPKERDVLQRVDRLEAASRHQLAWANKAEDEFDRINARVGQTGSPAAGSK